MRWDAQRARSRSKSTRRRWRRILIAAAVVLASCGPPEPDPLPPNSFAFAVFGDGPCRSWEFGRFKRLIRDVNGADLKWFLHVGDILWFPCTEAAYRSRLGSLNGIRHPVIYTSGDNEWADCHEDVAGRFEPLDRLDKLRAIFFADPSTSLGQHPMALESQSAEPGFEAFVENVRWRRGGFLFVTVHIVGGRNGSESFPERTEDYDKAVARRLAAAVAWMESAFRIA